MKAYLAIHFVALFFQFGISCFAYLISKESIEPWENFRDLKQVKFYFGLKYNGLGFDATTTIPIRIVDIIGNPKPMKHKSYEIQSLDLFLFLHIDLHS
jgi:hypothetical protein